MQNTLQTKNSHPLSQSLFKPVKAEVNFPQLEEACLKLWDEKKIFEKTIQEKKSAPTFNFYEGPPFATGMPHYGHLLAGIIKDIVPRYWTMQGYRVPRRFGWDCHGLPVEYEINKIYQLENRKAILKMGISKYNEACRSIVKRYAQEWKKIIHRVGRWIDMDTPYFTMDLDFMQSVWWVFHELFKKGLIYESYKVVPYSIGISTPLSHFEANLNYKNTQSPSLTVCFSLLEEPNTDILVWTTTPWSLPSNLALAVGETFDYVKVQDIATGKSRILAEARLNDFYKHEKNKIQILSRFKGETLLGKKYTPLFSYFLNKGKEGAFHIIHSDHVTLEDGTGIVHIAPAYGEEDYQACIREHIPIVNPVDDDGVFTAEVKDYEGKKVKDADQDIIADLKKKNRIFRHETINHSYPFCYRSDTPLIYRAVSSWFLAVEKIKDALIKSNKATSWHPEHIKEGRFGNWLENARDWAISRNRFWGTPLPIWKNPEGEVVCIGSKEELERYSGQKIKDLHGDVLDGITLPSPTGKTPLKRVDAVLDCWFESGSMPYAQWGFPYKNKENFEKSFPADFIAEGLDQTRGWFYTLMVIGTALYGQSPFKNVIVNGLILAEDGRKMSKSLRNFPDPIQVIEKHGADALRLYLIDSPVIKAQELKFSEEGIYTIVRKILLRWWNAYSFFINYANIDQFQPKGNSENSPNPLDHWILSRLHWLTLHTQKEMNAYHLDQVVPPLLQFIEELTNTYIRFNRSHFWQEKMPEDKGYAYETLFEVLYTLSKLMAPFTPFLAETTFQNLKRALPQEKRIESVHLERYPQANPALIKPELEEAVHAMETLVSLGRTQREKIAIKAKIPLKTLRIIHRNKEVLETLKQFEPYFKDELNVKEVHYDSDEAHFILMSAKANFPVLGKRLGSKMKQVALAIEKLDRTSLLKLEQNESLVVENESITLSDLEIRRTPKSNHPNLASHQIISIELDPTLSAEQISEGLSRELIRKIQIGRKTADFCLSDRIELQLFCSGALKEAAETYTALICKETLTLKLVFVDNPQGEFIQDIEIDTYFAKIGIKVLRA